MRYVVMMISRQKGTGSFAMETPIMVSLNMKRNPPRPSLAETPEERQAIKPRKTV